ncbi:MAG: oxidoreductase [Candidatus Bathyarchaeia archaeon]
MMADKLSVGIFKLTSCAGCQMQILHLEDRLLSLLPLVDIRFFKMATSEEHQGPYDVAFVEGAVSNMDQVALLKGIRLQSKVLVALGACACTGGINSVKNWMPQRELEARVYPDIAEVRSMKAFGLDEYVAVDAYLHGCPIEAEEFLDVVKFASLGLTRPQVGESVCVECKTRENTCLMKELNVRCMGSVTRAGCGALCPSRGAPCEGCRGPCKDPNPEALARLFTQLGLTREETYRVFRKYAGLMPEFREVSR